MPQSLLVPAAAPRGHGQNGVGAPKLNRSQRAATAKFLEVSCVLEEFKGIKEWQETHSERRMSLDSFGFGAMASLDTQAMKESLRGRLRTLVHHRFFTATIASLILLNAVYIGMETELVDDTSDNTLVWYLAEVGFTIIFLAELCMRILASRGVREFARDSWNVFDSALVLVSCIDTFVLTTIARNARKGVADDGQRQSNAISTIRTVRLARVARIFRLLRFFRELWVLVAGIVEAMWTLLWTWILLALLIYVSGVFATRTIGQPSNDPELLAYFGNVPRSMFTLFQVTTTEGWADIARQAMETQLWTAGFFIIYFYVTTCAILNVVVAVIVENTLDQAGDQREKFVNKQKRMQKEACSRIYEVFHSLDNNGDGMLTQEEFLLALRQEEVSRYLHQIGLDMRQAENLFSILDFDESGSLDAQEFVGGVMKAIGPGRAKDVLALQCDLWRSEEKIWERLQSAVQGADEKMTAVERGVRDLKKDVRQLVQRIGGKRQAVPGRKLQPLNTATGSHCSSVESSTFEPKISRAAAASGSSASACSAIQGRSSSEAARDDASTPSDLKFSSEVC